MAVYDALDADDPVRLTAGPVFFDQVARTWADSRTVDSLRKRGIADRAPRARPRPQFYPKAALADTQPIAVITEMRSAAGTVKKYRVPYFIRRLFWLAVDGPRDLIDALRGI
jgi:hypothetical protein